MGTQARGGAARALSHHDGLASSTAQQFIRGVIQDIMVDEQQKQREELTAMHLDILRMGRTWKVNQ